MADSIPGTTESTMNETWGHLHQQSLGLGWERLILQTENKQTSQTAMRAVKRHGGLQMPAEGAQKIFQEEAVSNSTPEGCLGVCGKHRWWKGEQNKTNTQPSPGLGRNTKLLSKMTGT